MFDTMERYETEFKNLFNRLGFSVDWSLLYRTVDEKSVVFHNVHLSN